MKSLATVFDFACTADLQSNATILELDCPLSCANDIGISHSAYSQAPKKAFSMKISIA
jgi:hypothetical protein